MNAQAEIMNVSGEFDVSLEPQNEQPSMGRLVLNKVYKGGLVGIANGQMLSKRSGVAGSAAYVALEDFTGSLGDKSGGFSLYHVGMMQAGTNELSIKVVPDSGTGGFTGISGSLEIDIKDGVHYYHFEYSF